MRQKRARKTDFEPAFADRVEHADLARKLQRVIEGRQTRAGYQLYPPAPLSSRAKENDRIGRITAVPVKVMFNDADVMKSELIGLGDHAQAFIEVDVRRPLLRRYIGEKIDSSFH